MSAAMQALEGVRIVEFGGYAAGPHIGKMLGKFGATVVHVESMSRPDGLRMQYPPYTDNKPGINAGGCFAYFNDSKFGITLDLKKPEAMALDRDVALLVSQRGVLGSVSHGRTLHGGTDGGRSGNAARRSAPSERGVQRNSQATRRGEADRGRNGV